MQGCPHPGGNVELHRSLQLQELDVMDGMGQHPNIMCYKAKVWAQRRDCSAEDIGFLMDICSGGSLLDSMR